MEIETQKAITPLGKQEIVFKKWITGGEQREIRNTIISQVEVSRSGEITKGETIKGNELVKLAENKAIECVIVSVDGKTENLVETILNMKVADFDYVMKIVNSVTSGTDFLG